MTNKTFHIIDIGCQMNKSDSERIAQYLSDRGLSEINEKYQADIVILTTCGIRQTAEDRVYGLIPSIKKKNKNAKIILTGCLANRKDVKRRLKNSVDIWMEIYQLPKLESLLKNQDTKAIIDPREYLKLTPKYKFKHSALIPIGNGCDNFCTYCVVPHARGREVYRNADEIISEIQELIKKDYREITLIAQNVNSYKSDNINFAQLLQMINNLEGDFWIRFLTSHPKDISDELIDTIAECEKVCKHIHLPAQSGDNEILQAMNRKYTREHYLNLINKIRNKIKNPAISTDIIVGFPGETKEQFNNTVKLFQEVNYDAAFIAQYSPRFGTAALKLKDNVTREEKKQRNKILVDIVTTSATELNEKYLNKTIRVLVDNKLKNNTFSGKSQTDKIVIFSYHGDPDKLLGTFVDVKITDSNSNSLKGNLVNE